MRSPPLTTSGRVRAALRVAGMLAIVGFVVWRVDMSAVRASWRGMSPGAVSLAAVAFCAAMSVRALKWRRQAEAVGLRFLPGLATRRFLLGVLLGVVTPMRLGELTRLSALEVPESERAPTLGLATAALLLEKLVEIVVLGALASLGAWVVWPDTVLGPLASLGVLALAVGVLAPIRPPGRLLEMLPAGLRGRVVQPALKARDDLAPMRRGELLALTGLAQGLNMLGGYQIYRAFGELDLLRFSFGMPLLTFASAAPFTVSGIGVREAAAMQVFGAQEYPASGAAIAASMVFLGANVLPCLALLPWTLLTSARSSSSRE